MKFLKGQALLRLGAQIASEFRLDPVLVLNANSIEWQVRLAAFEHIREEKKKDAEKMKASAKRGRGRRR